MSERHNIISSVFQTVVGLLSNTAGRHYTLTCGYESFVLSGQGNEELRMFLSIFLELFYPKIQKNLHSTL
ncbi:MAG: hypothetical protein LBR36_07115 [Bacteroidales bacterium]|nr:hypothetical protein [Bacteroidales bacterium]